MIPLLLLIAAVAADVWTFEVRSAGAPIGRETVVRDGESLRWIGGRRFGEAWWTYEGEARRDGDRLSWRDEGETREGSYVAEGSAALEVEGPAIVARHGRVAGIAALAAPLVARGAAAKGMRIARIDQHSRLRSNWTVAAAWSFHEGDEVGWRFELDGDVDEEGKVARAALLAGADGTPWRVAAFDLDAVREGLAHLPPASLRSTAVDDGPWRALLSPAVLATRDAETVRVRMRDGVRLTTDVHRPRSDGRFPTVLVRTPYHRWSEALLRPAVFVPRGYAVVIQDVRGRGASDGTFDPLVHEVDDGSDALDWIAAQPWSDGNVGMIGNSYVGWTQVLAAKSGNPHLKAIVPIVCPPDPDENFPYEGGALHLGVPWWAAVMDSMDEAGVLGGVPDLDWRPLLMRLPLTELDDAVETGHAFVDAWVSHPPHDDAYWRPRRHEDGFDRMDVAALHVTGWFDDDFPGAPRNFLGLRARAPGEVARRGQHLLIGPWGHAANTTRMLGRRDFGERAVIDLDAVVLRFFDRYLKGIENGIDREDPVRLFLIGPDEWVSGSDWPPAAAAPAPLHLASGGDAARRDGDGTLGTAAPDEDGADAFRCDPHDPRPIPLDFDDLVGESHLADWSAIEDRDDVLDYTSPPLAAPIDLLGPVTARLFFSTDAPDADVCVELLRVRPDGSSRRIAGGIQRLRYATDPRRDVPLEPGVPHEVEIDGWGVSRRIEAGDRLRVQVSGSLWPWYARNLHSLEPAHVATDGPVATHRVHHGPARPSRIVLPVVGGPERLRFR
ncbi:MAG: CocE/NonD family hydrolase [Planctomycetota bacterium JB042]